MACSVDSVNIGGFKYLTVYCVEGLGKFLVDGEKYPLYIEFEIDGRLSNVSVKSALILEEWVNGKSFETILPPDFEGIDKISEILNDRIENVKRMLNEWFQEELEKLMVLTGSDISVKVLPNGVEVRFEKSNVKYVVSQDGWVVTYEILEGNDAILKVVDWSGRFSSFVEEWKEIMGLYEKVREGSSVSSSVKGLYDDLRVLEKLVEDQKVKFVTSLDGSFGLWLSNVKMKFLEDKIEVRMDLGSLGDCLVELKRLPSNLKGLDIVNFILHDVVSIWGDVEWKGWW